jgi:hypothetical protein
MINYKLPTIDRIQLIATQIDTVNKDKNPEKRKFRTRSRILPDSILSLNFKLIQLNEIEEYGEGES